MARRPIVWTADQLDWVHQRCNMARKDLHAAFLMVWPDMPVTADNVAALCKRHGWKTGPEGRRRNKGRSFLFSPDEVAWLHQHATLSRNDAGREFRRAFDRAEVTDAQIVTWRKNNQVKTGRTGRFEKGLVPWSKGRKLPPNENSARTQFQPGQRPHTARPIGYESVSRDGYVLICVDRPNPWRPGQATHMTFKHKELWIAAHGPIPAGHVLKCLDGDKTNCDPSNWQAIPISMLPRLNGKSGRDYDRAPVELKPVIMATAQLEDAIKKRRRRNALS